MMSLFDGRRQEEHREALQGADEEPLLPGRRQFLIGTGLALAGLALGAHGWEKLAERRALAALPPAEANAPNVLLIVLDTVRAKNLSVYGYDRPTTPNLERLAEKGTTFEWAFSTAPWTLWSHLSMFTGRYPYETSADWLLPLGDAYPTLAEFLSARGYLTAGFVANTEYVSYETGLDRGFAHYEDYLVSAEELINNSALAQTVADDPRLRALIDSHELLGRKSAEHINRDFLGWLSGREEGRPYFAFLNYYDAHAPYLPPEPYDAKFGPKRPRENPMLHPGWEWTPQQIQAELDAYDGAIAYLDHHLGLLFEALKRRSEYENTLIIVTSDHGEEFGEHDLMGHANSLYLANLHVPLLISYPPRVPGGQRISKPVTLRDLPATVADLSGMEEAAPFPGRSLARHWNGDSSQKAAAPLLSEVNVSPWGLPDWYPISKGDMKSLIDERYHYIRNGDGREELYNYRQDSLEKRDLVRTEAGRQALPALLESTGFGRFLNSERRLFFRAEMPFHATETAFLLLLLLLQTCRA